MLILCESLFLALNCAVLVMVIKKTYLGKIEQKRYPIPELFNYKLKINKILE